MKTLRQSIFLPVFALIAFLGFGAGTVLADTGNEGVGGWSSEAVAPGQVSVELSGNPYGIDGYGDARFTSQPTASQPKRRAFVGTLDGITGASVSSITVILQTGGGGEQVIGLDSSINVSDGELEVSPALIRTPGGPRAGTAKNDAKVVVLANNTGGGVWTAISILVKPVAPPYTSHGLVMAVDGVEVTIETLDGDTETVTLPEGAGGVTTGEVITVFRGNSGKAKGLVRAEEVKNRLKRFLDDAEEDVDEPEEDVDGKGNKHDRAAAHAEKIANFLERFSQRQTRLLDRVMDRAPERVRVRLAQVRERIQAQRGKHRESIERIRTKLDRIHPEHSHRGRPEAIADHRRDSSDRGRPETADQRPDSSDRGGPETADQGGEHPTADDTDDGRGRGRGRGHGGTDPATPEVEAP